MQQISDYKITDQQAHSFAVAVAGGIKEYIDTHRDAYEEWLKKREEGENNG